MPTTCRRGDNTPTVRLLKDYLGDHGIRQTPGNYFDLVVEASVMALQERTHLEKDGIVGPKTWVEVQQATKIFPEEPDALKWIQHSTPYYPQRDNQYEPGGTCNVTSLAMVMAFHGVMPTKAPQLEDELFLRLQEPDALEYFNKAHPDLKKIGYKPRHVHGMLGWLAKAYGFQWSYSEKTSRDQINEFGKNIGPMITSGSFTRSGHIIVVVGMTAMDDLVVHDPWGNWNSGYRERDGKFKIYSREEMEKVLSGHSNTHKRMHRISK